jgi:hypothetical protein
MSKKRSISPRRVPDVRRKKSWLTWSFPGGEDLPLRIGLVERAEYLLEERRRGGRTADLGTLRHVAREEVEVVQACRHP